MAIIGYGLAGRVFHAPLIAATPGLALTSIVTGNAQRQAEAVERYPGIRTPADPRIALVVVDEGPDVADDWIAARAGPGDIVITADIPLAQRALAGGAQAVHPAGRPFTPDNIGAAMASREIGLAFTRQRIACFCTKCRTSMGISSALSRRGGT